MSGSTATRIVLSMFAGLLSVLTFTAPAQAAVEPATITGVSWTTIGTQYTNTDMAYVKTMHTDELKFPAYVAPKKKVVVKKAAPVSHTVSSSFKEILSGSLEMRALDIALTEIGKPYVYGATGPYSFDCSGLVYYIYHHVGYHGIARVAQAQYLQSQKVSRNDARPGDLVFFSDSSSNFYAFHVGIYLGHGMMVAAPHTGADVKIEAIKYVAPYIAFGRI